MMKVLADAELILEWFLNRNEYAKDAERLLEKVESRQIELYITQLCLDKVRSEDKFQAKPDAIGGGIASYLEDKGNVIPYDDCRISIEVFQSIENTRDFECAVETACAIACGVAVVTHKPEDFAGGDLLVWSVDNLLAIISLGDFVGQVLLRIQDIHQIKVKDVLESSRKKAHAMPSMQREQQNTQSAQEPQQPFHAAARYLNQLIKKI
ncbi:hypothetical protein B4U84_28905 [Westiellopsis prolifica IICB1]|nr:hypothetical protein B4U84_28905 [Westiellopsis prolifica IICB1]